jgi:integral membrane sensor domain MASE1
METAIIERIRTSTAAQAGLVGLSYFAGAELAQFFTFNIENHPLATFWPPTGLMVGFLVLSKYRVWPVFLLGSALANVTSNVLLHERPMAMCLGFFFANTGQICIAAWLLRFFVGGLFTLERIKEVLAMAFFAALLSSMFGAALGAAVVKSAVPSASYGSTWQTWFIGDFVGVLVFAPLVFTWNADWKALFRSSSSWRIVECAVLFLGLNLVAQAVYGELLPEPLMVPIFILPFLIWAALRFGPAGASAAVLVAGLIGVWNTAHGLGPYTIHDAEKSDQMLKAQGALAVVSLTVLVLAAATTERKQAERRRIALISELENALNEIKTLRGLIPLCAWCKKIRDDQGFWQGLEDYLRQHTEAQFTHGICPDCLQKELDPKIHGSSDSGGS